MKKELLIGFAGMTLTGYATGTQDFARTSRPVELDLQGQNSPLTLAPTSSLGDSLLRSIDSIPLSAIEAEAERALNASGNTTSTPEDLLRELNRTGLLPTDILPPHTTRHVPDSETDRTASASDPAAQEQAPTARNSVFLDAADALLKMTAAVTLAGHAARRLRQAESAALRSPPGRDEPVMRAARLH